MSRPALTRTTTNDTKILWQTPSAFFNYLILCMAGKAFWTRSIRFWNGLSSVTGGEIPHFAAFSISCYQVDCLQASRLGVSVSDLSSAANDGQAKWISVDFLLQGLTF